MQIPAGITPAQLPAYHAALAASGQFAVDVQVLTLDEAPVTTITTTVLDGQVNLNDDGDVSRTLSLTFYDPSGSIQLDSTSPADGAIYADRMLQVRHSIRVPGVGVATATLFTGPLVTLSRTGSEVSVEAHGKEALARSGVPPMVRPRGEFVVDAIQGILSGRCGETRFAFPAGIRTRLPGDVVVGWVDEQVPWRVCSALARTLGMQLFYDGPGVCRLRTLPEQAGFEFVADQAVGSNVTGDVQIGNDFTEIRNHVRVTGAIHVKGSATAPAGHPLSPDRLGRNGVPRFLPLLYEDDKIATDEQADRVAARELGRYLAGHPGVTFNAIPVFHLDPLDVCRVTTDAYTSDFRLLSASIPLVSGDMTVGYQTVVSRPRRRLRV